MIQELVLTRQAGANQRGIRRAVIDVLVKYGDITINHGSEVVMMAC